MGRETKRYGKKPFTFSCCHLPDTHRHSITAAEPSQEPVYLAVVSHVRQTVVEKPGFDPSLS